MESAEDLSGDPERWVAFDQACLYDNLQSPLILELKCEKRIPIWMSNLIQSFELRYQGFSKYGRGLETIFRRNHVDLYGLQGADYV